MSKKSGIELIAQERQEQIEKHNKTISDDVKNHPNCQLRNLANVTLFGGPQISTHAPFTIEMQKHLFGKVYKERLITAGAIIAAEIDRLQAVEESNETKKSAK